MCKNIINLQTMNVLKCLYLFVSRLIRNKKKGKLKIYADILVTNDYEIIMD